MLGWLLLLLIMMLLTGALCALSSQAAMETSFGKVRDGDDLLLWLVFHVLLTPLGNLMNSVADLFWPDGWQTRHVFAIGCILGSAAWFWFLWTFGH